MFQLFLLIIPNKQNIHNNKSPSQLIFVTASIHYKKICYYFNNKNNNLNIIM